MISLKSQLKLGKAKYTTKKEGNATNRVAPKYTINMIKLIGKTQNKRKRTIKRDEFRHQLCTKWTREMNFVINCAQNGHVQR